MVLITGGGRGLGLELARQAARRGAKIALLSRSEVELTAARDELRAAGATAEYAASDVRDAGGLKNAVDRLSAALGPVDVLINCAGIIAVGPVDALGLSDYETAIETNYLGAVRAVEAVRPAMQARKRGRIVNISSIGGKVVVPHLLPYCASKFALAAYSEGLRAELARDGIVVTTVIPGLMRTGSPPHATFAGQPRREYELFVLSDTLPFASVSAEFAARAILDGVQRGDIETVVSWQAKAAAAAYGLAPRSVIRVLTLLARALPTSGGSSEHRSGASSETPLTQSPLTALGRSATQTHNEAIDPVNRD
ncbi:MAG: SDR family oxidoreductase [Candidatus Eremiobacteraeota bacterium]|nr:SDR family oxidoreductase [Candidatus Eremiobacteraeota bacterium]